MWTEHNLSNCHVIIEDLASEELKEYSLVYYGHPMYKWLLTEVATGYTLESWMLPIDMAEYLNEVGARTLR